MISHPSIVAVGRIFSILPPVAGVPERKILCSASVLRTAFVLCDVLCPIKEDSSHIRVTFDAFLQIYFLNASHPFVLYASYPITMAFLSEHCINWLIPSFFVLLYPLNTCISVCSVNSSIHCCTVDLRTRHTNISEP